MDWNSAVSSCNSEQVAGVVGKIDERGFILFSIPDDYYLYEHCFFLGGGRVAGGDVKHTSLIFIYLLFVAGCELLDHPSNGKKWCW